MKKYLLASFLLAYLGLLPGAAQKFQFSLSSGYAFGSFNTRVQSMYDYESDNITVKTNNRSFSLGKGIPLHLSLNFFFNDHIGVALDYSYSFGLSTRFQHNMVIQSVTQNSDIELYGNQSAVMPSFILRGTPDNRLIPFIKAGPVLAAIKQYYHVKTIVHGGLITTTTEDWYYKGPSAAGVFSETGLWYTLNDRLLLSLSLSATALFYRPHERILLKSTFNNKDNTFSLSESQKHYVYVNWISDEYNGQAPDPNKALEVPAEDYSYGSLSILLGISYSF